MTKETINILLVEDSQTDAEIVRRTLRRNMSRPCRVQHSTTMLEAERVLQTDPGIDIVLLDLELPDTEGRMDTFQKLEKAKKKPIPTVILTSLNDSELAVGMVEDGAESYVRKSRISVDPKSLCETIDFALARHNKKLNLRESEAEKLAEKDQIIKWMSGGYSV